jgi:hypothetical protein
MLSLFAQVGVPKRISHTIGRLVGTCSSAIDSADAKLTALGSAGGSLEEVDVAPEVVEMAFGFVSCVDILGLGI